MHRHSATWRLSTIAGVRPLFVGRPTQPGNAQPHPSAPRVEPPQQRQLRRTSGRLLLADSCRSGDKARLMKSTASAPSIGQGDAEHSAGRRLCEQVECRLYRSGEELCAGMPVDRPTRMKALSPIPPGRPPLTRSTSSLPVGSMLALARAGSPRPFPPPLTDEPALGIRRIGVEIGERRLGDLLPGNGQQACRQLRIHPAVDVGERRPGGRESESAARPEQRAGPRGWRIESRKKRFEKSKSSIVGRI